MVRMIRIWKFEAVYLGEWLSIVPYKSPVRRGFYWAFWYFGMI